MKGDQKGRFKFPILRIIYAFIFINVGWLMNVWIFGFDFFDFAIRMELLFTESLYQEESAGLRCFMAYRTSRGPLFLQAEMFNIKFPLGLLLGLNP